MTRRSQLSRDVGKEDPGKGNSKCKGPEARTNLTCLRKGKKASMIGPWKAKGEQVGGHEVRQVGGTDGIQPHQLWLVHIFFVTGSLWKVLGKS